MHSVTAPYSATDIKATCQPQCWLKKPPKGGLVQANTPKPVMVFDMTRAPSSGWYKSRTTARALVMTAPMPMPCNTRQKISTPIELLSTQPMAATRYKPKPNNMMGRRPTLSENGPHSNCEMPKASNKPLSVNCTMPTLAFKSSAKPGRAGRYKSVDTGCKPMDKDSNKINKPACINGPAKTSCPNRAYPVAARWGDRDCIGRHAR